MTARVLLVEDDPTNADFLTRFLRRRGYEVEVTDTAQGALTIVAEKNPQIVLLDLTLPDRDGWATAEELHKVPGAARTPIIIMAAQSSPGVRDRAKTAGCQAVASKFFDFDQLSRTIAELVSASEGESLQQVTHDLDLGNILVVDDEEANRQMLRRRLELHGYRVETASSGMEALAALEASPKDLVLLDVMMPKMDGLETLRRIRESVEHGELPIIMVTARTDSEDVVDALERGASDHIPKPIDFPVALARIRSHISRKRAEESLRESEERYALAMRGSNDAIWDWHVVRNEVHLSPRWFEMLGYREGEIGRTIEDWLMLVHPSEQSIMKRLLNSHVDGTSNKFELEYRIRHKDGVYRHMLARGLAVRDDKGRAYRVAGSQSDITFRQTIDNLTGLPNRTFLLDSIERSIGRAQADGAYKFGLLLLDLDRFKVINDSMGHETGDNLLNAVSHRLQEHSIPLSTALGCESRLVRLGGDEFAFLLDEISDALIASRFAESIQSELNRPFNINGTEVFVTTSIGVVTNSKIYESPNDVIRDADTAMNGAKAMGTSRYQEFAAPMGEVAKKRLRLENELRRSIDRNELEVYYQPIIDLRKGELCGFEALVRWRHPTLGFVSPIDFIPTAEEIGFIGRIDRWVLREASIQVKRWQKLSGVPLNISANVSGVHLEDPGIVHEVAQALHSSDLDPKCVKLEVTETVVMKNAIAVEKTLDKLRALEVELSIDDFGTGYSSLSHLHRFPVQTLKVDRSFVSYMSGGNNQAEIVRTIISLAHALRMDVTAEGVETAEQLALLRELSCEHAQGYFISKPLSRDDAEAFILAKKRW